MVKKLLKRIKDAIVFDTDEKFNEFGTCIPCQNGRRECLHNNQGYKGRNIICLTCGITLK